MTVLHVAPRKLLCKAGWLVEVCYTSELGEPTSGRRQGLYVHIKQIVSRREILLTTTLLVSLPLSGAAEATELADPFAPNRARLDEVAPLALSACPLSMPVVHGLNGVRFYTDPQSTRIDPKLKKANVAANQPLTDFTAAVEGAAAIWLSRRGSTATPAECGLNLLRQWAVNDGLLGEFNTQGEASQRWNTAGLGIAYLALRHALPTSHDAQLGSWFDKLGCACRQSIGRAKNNHLNWTAAAVASSAIAARNTDLWRWSIETAKFCIGQIQQDGSLPLELARGSHALGYHSFALAPLLLVSELALANGINLYGEGKGALARLASFIIENTPDTSQVDKLAGAVQDWNGLNIPWSVIGARRFLGPLGASLARIPAQTNAYMGGNQLLLFGA